MKKKIILSLCLVFTALNANNFGHQAQYTHNIQDKLSAFKYYHKSASKGYSTSQYELALMFHYGLAVRQNEALARLWFKRAARKGHIKAQSILYRFYSAKKPEYFPTQGTRYRMYTRR
ncbi:MAG TPA: sel1 repeat family protein [Campylobacterales bacterium]|nr:sel1 repeat family protein [Campylobacterales bacterium]